jgi:hypothetical protein
MELPLGEFVSAITVSVRRGRGRFRMAADSGYPHGITDGWDAMLRPKDQRAGLQRQPRGWPGADQARRALAAPGAALLVLPVVLLILGGCGRLPDEVNPAVVWRHATGASAADRLPPPHLDAPYPNLGTVPPRPDRPDPAVREAMTAALAAERARSRQPLEPSAAAGPAAAAALLGRPPVPAAPPPRPALAVAPRIALEPPATAVVAPRAAAPPAAPEVAGPEGAARGDAAAAAGTAPIGAPRPSDAPPPSPPGELLAPGAAPPPPPPADLLAPPRGG